MKGLLGLEKKGMFKKLKFNMPGKWDYIHSESRDKMSFRYIAVESGPNNKKPTYFVLLASSDTSVDFGRVPGSNSNMDLDETN